MNESLRIGGEQTDREHEALLKSLLSMIEASGGFDGSEVSFQELSRLGQDLMLHLEREEGLMRDLGKPTEQIALRRRAHVTIVEQYTELNFDLMRGKSVSQTDILALLRRWIIDHIACHFLIKP